MGSHTLHNYNTEFKWIDIGIPQTSSQQTHLSRSVGLAVTSWTWESLQVVLIQAGSGLEDGWVVQNEW